MYNASSCSQEDRRIHEFVVHLGLYAKALNDGATIARNVSDALMGSDKDGVQYLDFKLQNWKATAIDRYCTSKKELDIVHKDHTVLPFCAHCVSR